MNEAIIINILCTVVGALLGIVAALLIRNRDKRAVNMKRDFKSSLWHIILFYDLEKEYLAEWANRFPEEKTEAIKRSFRKKVKDKYENRTIEMTDNSAKDMLSKYF